MSNHRALRMAEAIREVVSESILFSVSDPRVRGVTILEAEVSSDLRTAIVHYSVMGTDAQKREAVKGLQSATGYLQTKVAGRLQTKFCPVLKFKKVEGISKAVEMSKLIDDVLAADRAKVAFEAPPLPEDAELEADDDDLDDFEDDDLDEDEFDEDKDEDTAADDDDDTEDEDEDDEDSEAEKKREQ